MRLLGILLVLSCGGFSGLAASASDSGVEVAALTTSARPAARAKPPVEPRLRWSHVAGSETWSRALVAALSSYGQALEQSTPKDIQAWCPGYKTAKPEGRRLFWAGLISALSEHESSFRPRVVGDGGKSIGLMQIRVGTARAYGCAARSRAALQFPADNLRCAVRIMAQTVPRDNVVSRGMRGAAADWGPFHQRKKREGMRAWISQQPYCQKPVTLGLPRPTIRPIFAQASEIRPIARPARAGSGQNQ